MPSATHVDAGANGCVRRSFRVSTRANRLAGASHACKSDVDGAKTPNASGTGIEPTDAEADEDEVPRRPSSSASPTASRVAATAALISFGPNARPFARRIAARNTSAASSGDTSSFAPSVRRIDARSASFAGASYANGASAVRLRKNRREGASIAAPPATGTNVAVRNASTVAASSASTAGAMAASAAETASTGSPAVSGDHRESAASLPPSRAGAPNATRCFATVAGAGADLTRSWARANDGGTISGESTGRTMNPSRHDSGASESAKDVNTLHPTAPGPGAPGRPNAAGTKGTHAMVSHNAVLNRVDVFRAKCAASMPPAAKIIPASRSKASSSFSAVFFSAASSASSSESDAVAADIAAGALG